MYIFYCNYIVIVNVSVINVNTLKMTAQLRAVTFKSLFYVSAIMT